MTCPTFKVSSNRGTKSTKMSEVGKVNASVNGGQCLIKGNISKRSDKHLYFTSSHPNYHSVKISINKGERCFNTEAEAQKAGWLKAQ